MAAAGVHFKTNTKVTGADVKAHTLTTETGDTITYQKLIVATGCRVREPMCLCLSTVRAPGVDTKGSLEFCEWKGPRHESLAPLTGDDVSSFALRNDSIVKVGP